MQRWRAWTKDTLNVKSEAEDKYERTMLMEKMQREEM
jgi:hypothetical protein